MRAERLERLRLNFPGLPMREGRFFVDVGLTTGDREAELARAERALERRVFGSDGSGSGPIRLGGTWELPASTGPARARLPSASEPLLVRACRREPVERTPVWFMRQAGRSLPEYRELRRKYGLFEIARQPQLCAEVTLQPVRRHDVDAAVMFADIMLPVLGMGVDVELVENVGPVVGSPMRSLADVERLVVPVPEESVPWVLESVRLVRDELREDQALVGFAGGPFTVAGYLIEGKPTREFKLTKACMYGEPEVWHALMEKLADAFALYVARVRGSGRGCDPAVRLVGRRALGRRLPRVRRALLGARAGRGGRADDPLRDRRRAPAGGARGGRRRRDRGRLARPARRRLGARRPRPRDPGEPRRRGAARPVGAGGGRRRATCSSGRAGGPGHIFNLGHGVLPETDPELLGRLVRLVHEDDDGAGMSDAVILMAYGSPSTPRRTSARTSRTCAAGGRSPTRRSPSSPSATGGSAGARRSTR